MLYGDYLDLEPRNPQPADLKHEDLKPELLHAEKRVTDERSPRSFRAGSWADFGSVLGNLLGGTLFIGGMLMLPMVLRQLMSLL